MSSKTSAEIVGPGVWLILHFKSLSSSPEEFKKFTDEVKKMFPCEICIRHLEIFCKNHPFDNYKGITNREGHDIGMFQWTWMLHNSVNIRLGKPRMDFDTAYNMYKNHTQCHSKCGI